MAEFPTTFAETPHVIQPSDVPAKFAMTFMQLSSKGYDVVAGLDRASVPALTEIAEQEGVREFCPNDLTRRWGNGEMAAQQLAKAGGRGVLRLVNRRDNSTLGFGWTGSISEEERALLPMCENTFALRLHEAARGKKLGEPFSRAIVAGSMALWGARNIGLETWASNTAAVKTYLNAGAPLVTTKDDVRPTLNRHNFQYQNHRNDVRLYMNFPWSA